MRAALFFNLVLKGRSVERRKRYRDFYELTRVACYPQYTPESQQELARYFLDGSLTENEYLEREKRRLEIEEENKSRSEQRSVKNVKALEVFRELRGVH